MCACVCACVRVCAHACKYKLIVSDEQDTRMELSLLANSCYSSFGAFFQDKDLLLDGEFVPPLVFFRKMLQKSKEYDHQYSSIVSYEQN